MGWFNWTKRRTQRFSANNGQRNRGPFVLLRLEELERRVNPTGNIAITNALVVDGSNNPLTMVTAGQSVDIQADFTTRNLPSNASYRVGITVNGLTLDSSYITWGAGGSGTASWNLYYGTFLATPGVNQVTVVVDPDQSVTETSYADNTMSFNFTAASAPAGTFMSYTVAQMRTAYAVNNISNFGTATADGTGQTIAVVDAGNEASILTDLDGFDQAMSLTTNSTTTLYQQYGAASSFVTVYNQSGMNITANIGTSGANGVPVADPTGHFEIEETLDVEWAHAFAPGAHIDIIEVNYDDYYPTTANNLLAGDAVAGSLPGVSVVSNSWIMDEWSGQASVDSSTFVTPSGHTGVTFLAATGDNGANVYGQYGPSVGSDGFYPATSANVVAVGGTQLTLNNNAYGSETGWSYSTPESVTANGSSSYVQNGSWTPHTGGFSGSYSSAAGGSNSSAAWTLPISSANFGNGTVVSATWTASPSNATNATYTIYDGTQASGTIIGTVVVNQTQAPTGTADGGSQFQELGVFYPTLSESGTGTFTVVLNANTANSTVVADAIGSAQGWAGTGGPSQFEAEPSYQLPFQSTGYRTTPDVSMDASENSGVALYYNGSLGVGAYGTSLACPCWAALIAIANQGLVAAGGATLNSPANPQQTLQALYSLPASDFHDITTGYNGFSAGTGYDDVTGRGTPIANTLIPDLIDYGLMPTANLVVTNAFLVNSNDQPLTEVNAGEEVYVQVNFTTQNLPSNASYRFAFTVNGTTLDTWFYLNWGAGNSGAYSWSTYYGIFISSAGTNQAQVTIDPDHSVLETTYSDNTFSFTFNAASPAVGNTVYSVAQIRAAYGINSIPNFGAATPDGSGQTIAVVDAGNDPNILTDLDGFDESMTFTLSSAQTLYQLYGTASSFVTVYNQEGMNITPNLANSGIDGVPVEDPTNHFESEESLDVEWAHAIAPGAHIDIIEVNYDDYYPTTANNLLAGDAVAGSLPGVSVVSNSWSMDEWSGQSSADSSTFVTPSGHTGVTFLVASGDNGANVYGQYGPSVGSDGFYPATSANVVAVGGTQLTLNNNAYGSETGWSYSTPESVTANGSSSYTQNGSWTAHAGGLSGTYSTAAGGSSGSASWTIAVTPANTDAGTEVSATWTASPSNATNATYTIYDGTQASGTIIGTVVVNQTRASTGTADGGSQFQELGVFYPTLSTQGTGTLTVVLNANSANGTVVADAIGSAAALASTGGPSQFESEPSYQLPYQSTGYRTIPDVSLDGSQNSVVFYYWNGTLIYGGYGTSLACPCWAGLIAIANQGRVAAGGTTLNSPANPQQTLQALYSLPATDFHDITTGYNGFFAGSGYDEVTGRGTPFANNLVPDLVGYGTTPTVTGISPNAGSVTGGATVTISGTNFIGTTSVHFGNIAATSFTVVNSTQIMAVSPAESAGIVDVTVITVGGASALSAADHFTYVAPTFQVSSTTLLSGDNGFLVTFSAPYNISALSLYTGDSGHVLTTRSVQITGPGGATFGGTTPDTLRFNAVPVNSTQLEFILTGLNHVAAPPVLPAGTYTLTLDGGSSDPAFRRLSDGAYLDGNGDGTIEAVDNYTTTVSVNAIPASTDLVGIGDLVAGPGQTVAVPLVLGGGAGSVSQTTAVNLTIAAPANGAYSVTGFTVNSAISGITANFSPATGTLTLSSATPFSTSDGPLLLGNFTVAVASLGNGDSAPGIDTKTPITINVASVLDGSTPKPFVSVNAFHVSAYLGNLVAPIGIYNSADISQLQGLIVTSVRAFALYPNVDPYLLADVNRDGVVNSSDVSQLQARIIGATSVVPPLPAGASGVAVNGTDPVLFVGSSYTPNAQPANLGSLRPGSTVLVPLSVFVTDPHGVNVTAAEVAFSFDPKVFTLNCVNAGAIADGSLGGSPFSIAFSQVAPGELEVIGSSSIGPNLPYAQTATLFLVSLTVRPNAPAGGTVFNLMSSEGSFQTGLQDNQSRNLVLLPAPEAEAGNNLDGAFTVESGKSVQLPVGISGDTAAPVVKKQAGSVTTLTPAAWEQLTALLFEAASNQTVVNGSNGGMAVAAAMPTTAAAENKKQAVSFTALQPVAWERLTTRLFEEAAKEADFNGNLTIQMSSR